MKTRLKLIQMCLFFVMFEFNKFNFVLERKASKLAECPSPDGSDIPRFLAWIQPKARPQSCRYGNGKGNFLLWGYAQIKVATLEITILITTFCHSIKKQYISAVKIISKNGIKMPQTNLL